MNDLQHNPSPEKQAEQPSRRRIRLRRTPPMSENLTAPKKLKLLFTIVDRNKAEFYADLLSSFSVNLQVIFAASGTAKTEMLSLLGLGQTDKAVILSAINDESAPHALEMLEEKFKTIKNGKGIAFSVPMTSVIGVAIYQLLSNDRTSQRSQSNGSSEKTDDKDTSSGKERKSK